MRAAGPCLVESTLDAATRRTLVEAIGGSADANPFVRDVTLAEAAAANCTSELDGVHAMGARRAELCDL